MSDTTPRPDETTSDPVATPPPPPADVEATEVVPSPEEVAAHQPVQDDVPAAQPAVDQAVAPQQPEQPAFSQAVAPQQPEQPAFSQAVAPQQVEQQPPPPPPPPAYGAPAGQEMVPNPMKPSDERTTGMAAHLVALGGTILSSGFLGFVCALVMYLVFRDRGPFVRAHAANALNIQIIAGIVMLVSLPLMFVLIGFLTFGAAVVWAVIMHIIGAVKANNGEWWNPPMTPQFVK